MPVRSLNSSIFRWPDREEVDRAVRAWGAAEAARRPEILRLGYFGSYATGRWGVGSDVDLVAIVRESPEPWERRARSWDVSALPVPADLFVYTAAEWKRMQREGGRFARMLAKDTVWVVPSGARSSESS